MTNPNHKLYSSRHISSKTEKRMNINLQKLNPLKKTEDQKRDNDGKFTAGSGGLAKLKKFNWGRSAPIIVLIALAGGFLVFRSFAGTKTPAYQYSVYDTKNCVGFDKTKTTVNADPKSCANLSAEALTYRLYEGILGRAPETGATSTANATTGQPAKVSGYAYWTQRLAGERTHTTRVTQLIMASNEATGNVSDGQYVANLYLNVLGRPAGTADPTGVTYWTKQLTTKAKTRAEALAYFAAHATPKKTVQQAQTDMGYPTNQKFIENLYAGFLGRTPTATGSGATATTAIDSSGLAYWKGKLDNKKYTRDQIAAVFAQSKESVAFYATRFSTFISNAPKVTVVQSTANKQAADAKYAHDTLNVQTANIVALIKQGTADNLTRKNASETIANKSQAQISSADLTTIRNNSSTILSRLVAYKGASSQKQVVANYNKIKSLYNSAVAVTKYSPDISDADITTDLSYAKARVTEVQSHVDNANWLLGLTNTALTTATNKHNAEVNGKANCQNSGGTWASSHCTAPIIQSGGPEPTGNCNGVKANSDPAKIKACQKELGLSSQGQDGKWGCVTEAAFRHIHPNSDHRVTCPNLGDGPHAGDSPCKGKPDAVYYDYHYSTKPRNSTETIYQIQSRKVTCTNGHETKVEAWTNAREISQSTYSANHGSHEQDLWAPGK